MHYYIECISSSLDWIIHDVILFYFQTWSSWRCSRRASTAWWWCAAAAGKSSQYTLNAVDRWRSRNSGTFSGAKTRRNIFGVWQRRLSNQRGFRGERTVSFSLSSDRQEKDGFATKSVSSLPCSTTPPPRNRPPRPPRISNPGHNTQMVLGWNYWRYE